VTLPQDHITDKNFIYGLTAKNVKAYKEKKMRADSSLKGITVNALVLKLFNLKKMTGDFS